MICCKKNELVERLNLERYKEKTFKINVKFMGVQFLRLLAKGVD